MKRTLPPPVRRIELGQPPTVAAPKPGGADTRPAPPASTVTAQRAARPPVARAVERMRIESVSLAYGDRWVVRDVSLPVRQGEVLALIGASGSG
jgi:phosphate transport system ATP-binding protein